MDHTNEELTTDFTDGADINEKKQSVKSVVKFSGAALLLQVIRG